MSAIEEVITALQDVVDKLDDAKSASGSAGGEVDDAIGQATAVGIAPTIAALNTVKDSIDKLGQQISATIDTANETINHAKAVANGT